MLHRSRSFASEGGSPVDILTFDDFRDYSVIRGVLQDRGFLSEGTRVRNLWEELPAMADTLTAEATAGSHAVNQTFGSFFPLTAQSDAKPVELEGPHRRLVRYAADGKTTLQVDHFRSDGTLLLSDRHDAQRLGEHGGRSLTLCDSEGAPLQHWGSAWGLYRSWLDYIVAGEQAYFVVDNKNTARFMASYQRGSSVVLYQVHESHLEDATAGFASEMTVSAQEVFPRLDAFDGVVFLTEQQAADVRRRQSDDDRTYIIPNGRSLGAAPEAEVPRNPRMGMQAATLSHRKRVDHSVRAVHLANSILSSAVGLKVFGDGSQRSQLEEMISDLHESDNVELMGHVTSAQSYFREVSFSLLTSTSEALPLVLIESMAAGCIPIVYDLPYGPAAVITDGVDGFLVEYGNIQKLAECIAKFVEMPESQVSRMREAARKRATDFSDRRVVLLWVDAMETAAAKKLAASIEHTVEILDSACSFGTGGVLEVHATVKLGLPQATSQEVVPAFHCRLRRRQSEVFFRVVAKTVTRGSSETYTVRFCFEPDILTALGSSTADVFLETRVGAGVTVSRMPLTGVTSAPRVYATAHSNMSITFA